MLLGKNVVVIKLEGGAMQVVPFDRVYLEFGPNDKTESYGKKSGGKDLTVSDANGKETVWEGVRPAATKTTHDTAELVQAAVDYFAAKYPGTAEQPTDAWLTLLEAASYGEDLWIRNKIQADLRPTKPITQDAAVAKMVKTLMAANPKLTVEKATLRAKAALGEDE